MKITGKIIPAYHGERMFIGKKDLVVSYYTEACPFRCGFCSLNLLASNFPVPVEDIISQIDWLFDHYKSELGDFEQVSIGNNGSILDTKRFPSQALDYFLEKSKIFSKLEVLSLETRPEYLAKNELIKIKDKVPAVNLDVAIGFETLDDHLRNNVLNKRLDRKTFENKIKLLGDLNIRATVYVMLKPGSLMTEEEGISEAISTIRYLAQICKDANTELIIYLNPTYVSKDSALSKIWKTIDYKPPKIQSVIKTILMVKDLGIPIYTGLWNEGLAEKNGDYKAREGYDKYPRDAIKKFNNT